MGVKFSHPDPMLRYVDFLDIARQAITSDCHKTFIGAIRDQQFTEFYHYGKVYTAECPSEFVRLIFQHRAVNCATSILQGDARFKVNLNVPWIDGLPPLHLAARNLSLDLTKLFLLHGAHPNLSSHTLDHGYDKSIPLCLALDAISCNPCVTDWSLEKSPVKLIYILCIKELRESLDTIKLLASRTKDLDIISLRYAQKGEVVQLTALLLVAWDKLVAPYAIEGVEYSLVVQCLSHEMELLSDQQMNGQQCCCRKSQLECARKILNVLGDSHDRIEECLYRSKFAEIPSDDVPLDVAYMLYGRAELDPDKDLSYDDVQCLMPRLKPEVEDVLRPHIRKLMHSEPPTPTASVVTNNFSLDVDFLDIARQAITSDCHMTFIAAIRDQQFIESYHYGKVYTAECPFEFVRLIFEHRAVNCATSILQGDARFYVDLNVPWIDGLPPLHLAARNLSLDFTKLFLLHGAPPSLSFHSLDHFDDENIPLCLALEAISCNPCVTDWSLEKSPVKLIYILCIKELRESLDTIKLLASRTENLHKISLRCAEKGEVVQLTALLLVAWDKLVAPYAKKGVEYSPIGQCISRKIKLLSDQQKNGQQCCFRKSRLECARKILNVLGDSHDRIEEYLYWSKFAEISSYDVPLDVAYMLYGRAELDPDKDLFCDDVQCLMLRLKPEEADVLKQDLRKLMHSGPPAPTPSVVSNNFLLGIGARASHSFHTGSKPKLPKDLEKVPKFSSFCPLVNARMCALLFSTIKRSFK